MIESPSEDLEIMGEWIVARVEECTCAAPGPYWGHEPHCGYEPVVYMGAPMNGDIG
jgi:hypothetical protein